MRAKHNDNEAEAQRGPTMVYRSRHRRIGGQKRSTRPDWPRTGRVQATDTLV
jgi:hypothetical protein